MMAVRACVVLLLALSTCAARDCIVTLSDKSLSDSIFNGSIDRSITESIINSTIERPIVDDTILNLTSKNASFVESARVNIVELWERFPKLVVPRNATSEQCRRDGQLYLDSLEKLELWALKMFDATAKPPSGILNGNGNQYGDFDECLSIDGAVRGKYCLASLEVNLKDDRLQEADYLLHSGHYIRSNITDMGHRVPRYSSILWGVCIPSSCSSFDLEEELTQRLSGLGVNVKVHNTMCSVKEVKRPYSFGKSLAITFFLAILLLLSLGTLLDDGTDSPTSTNFEKLLNAFSLKRNLRKVLTGHGGFSEYLHRFKCKESPSCLCDPEENESVFDLSDDSCRVKGVDMFRGMNAFALLLAHKSMAMAHNPYVNKVTYSAVFGMPWAVAGRSAILYTDSFLYLSGYLNANNLLQELERKGSIDIKSRLISRWFRLFPLFVSLMLFCTYILPDVNNGPQWNLVVEEHARVCEKHMWKSFLFIHNWFGFEDMCLTHTHQIGIDMQLYVMTLPLMLLLWKSKTLGWTVVVGIAVASTLLRYLAVYWHHISMFVYFGISVQKLLDAARFCYILPTHRATIYLIGVAMAYFMRTKKLNFTLSLLQSRLLWLGSFALMAFTICYPYEMGLEGYRFEPRGAAGFAAFSPIMWGLYMSVAHWAICNRYASSKGTQFLELPIFKFFNKIAYGVYLTQFPIFFYNVGIQRHSEFYSPLLLFHVPEMLSILVISIATTVAIEMPFNQVYRIYFGKSQTKLKEK